MSDDQIVDRFKTAPSIEEIERYGTPLQAVELSETILSEGKPIKRLRSMSRENVCD